MPKIVTVYVKLLEEGSDSWRPANARALPNGTFELLGIDGPGIEDEVWEFPVHSRVICQEKSNHEGKGILVAIAFA
jgi:hypothetical protein